MADVFCVHAAALADVESYLGAACPTFTWLGAAFRCFPGSARDAKALDLGGFKPGADLTIVCRVDQFPAIAPDTSPALPDIQEFLLYPAGGRRWRIDAVETLPGGKLLRLSCNDPAQSV
jgi:hypothetical protein